MNNKILRILIMLTLGAAVGTVVGYIVSRRRRIYFGKDDVEYVNPTNIDIPIVLMDEETE